MTVNGKQTVNVGKTKEPVVNDQIHVMAMLPAGMIQGAQQAQISTPIEMVRDAVK